jgi:Na+-driven multidrug efflux pump
MPLLDGALALIGATGRTSDIASRFLLFVIPSSPLLGIGMAGAGFLRALGDARRAMMVTLSSALVAAVADPLLIFVLGLGMDGAALATIAARLALTAVALRGCTHAHALLALPRASALAIDGRLIGVIAVPAVLTNVATPVGNTAVTAAIARFGDSAVAGWAVIGRLTPLAFGAVFALSGSVGPILAQNLGAARFDRVESALRDSAVFTLGYCLAIWLVLFALREELVAVFGLAGEGAMLVRFFCSIIAGSFIFTGALFVANAAFNNLGFPTLSTVFNWARATLGTFPFVAVGAAAAGAPGVLGGWAAGGVVFGSAALLACFAVVRRLARKRPTTV